MLLFAKNKELVIEKRTVRVDGKLQLEFIVDLALVYRIGDNRLGKFDALVDGIPAQKRFATEKSDVQILLLKENRSFQPNADCLFESRIVHDRFAVRLRLFVIAISTA